MRLLCISTSQIFKLQSFNVIYICIQRNVLPCFTFSFFFRKVNTINKIINIEDSSIDFNDLERLNNSSNSKKFTPKKHRRSNPTTPNRYSSLDVTVKKSPRSRAPSGDFSEKEFLSSQNSPKARTFFDKFQLNATLIQLKKKLSQNDDEIAESSISKKGL